MPSCPVCRDEFEPGVAVCPDDGVALVPAEELPPRPVGDSSLGVFHPVVAAVVMRMLLARDVPVRPVEVDERTVELRVPADVRDRLRADLTVQWSDVLRLVEPEDRAAVARVGEDLPGWHDAPAGAWVDREGRLRVDASVEEEAVADASRTIGPGMALAGAVGLLLAWTTGGSELLWLASGSALLLGVLLPR